MRKQNFYQSTALRGLPVMVLVCAFLVKALSAAEGTGFDKDQFLKQGFKPLFNGKDLSGWKVPKGDNGHWKVVDGVIDYDARSEARGDKNLWTKESFKDFVLHIEWRLKRTSGLYPMPEILPDGSLKRDKDGNVIIHRRPNADSGIFLRGTGKGQVNIWCWPVGSGELWGYRTDRSMPPSVRAAAVPKVHADNPVGEWNGYDITMNGETVNVVLNGKTVIENARMPGIPREGPVGLQHHGGFNKKTGKLRPASSLIQFRNIYIKELDASDEPASQKRGPGTGKAFSLAPDKHGKVLETPDGRVVFRYMTEKPAKCKLTANSVCCFYPVYTPSGERVVDFAPSDHRHHRGIFLAWHCMEGEVKSDFWGWGAWAPTDGRIIKNRKVKLTGADQDHAALSINNAWMVKEEVLVDERLSVQVSEQKGVYVVDLDYRLTPAKDLKLHQTAFGGLCVKGRKGRKSMYTDPSGEVDRPKPHYLKPETDWPEQNWYDYTFQLENGKSAGVAVMDHSENPPSPWHNLKPIAMVNPCIVAEGPAVLKKNQPFRLRYRLAVHDGKAPVKLLNRLYEEWSGK